MNKTNFILVTGADGLLGSYVTKELDKNGISYKGFSRKMLDITDSSSLSNAFMNSKPTHVINCAAFTNVLKAEENKTAAYLVNVEGTRNLVYYSNMFSTKLIHISTDFVFDGNSDSGVYFPDSKKNPLNYYGFTKHLAEEHIIEYSRKYLIIRTSWLYGERSNNFVSKILHMAKLGHEITVVNDEFGSPTYALDLASKIISIVQEPISGIIHLTNSGSVSRYDLACKISDLSNYNAIIKPANFSYDDIHRPKKVILKNSNLEHLLKLRSWEEALMEFINKSLMT
jgi:dTDP-4-dehydrorhamnose reductase